MPNVTSETHTLLPAVACCLLLPTAACCWPLLAAAGYGSEGRRLLQLQLPLLVLSRVHPAAAAAAAAAADQKQAQTIEWPRVPPNAMACKVMTNDQFQLSCLLQLSA